MASPRGESVISRANDQVVWPWQAEPHGLWSLLDMMRFYAASFLATYNNLQVIQNEIPFAAMAPEMGLPRPDWPDIQDRLRKALRELAKACKDLPVSATMVRQIVRASDEVTVGDDANNHGTIARLVEIQKNLVHELSGHYFLAIAEHRRPLYFDNGRTFGKVVEDAFPDSTNEIKSANRCFALDEWTACVFHLMRTLEIALHKWAKDLGVDQFSAIELENWKNILDAADKKVRALEQQGKSVAKDVELQYYGETMGHYRSIKDAWRNHVSHARTTYDEGQATSIMNHVCEFMSLLANRP